MSLLEDFHDYLQAQGLASGWALKLGVMPPEPHRVIALFPSGGTVPPTKRVGIDAPSLQIRVRGAEHEYEATYTKAKQINAALHELRGQIGSGVYPWVLAQHDPAPLGYDELQRPEFSLNFNLAREAA